MKEHIWVSTPVGPRMAIGLMDEVGPITNRHSNF